MDCCCFREQSNQKRRRVKTREHEKKKTRHGCYYSKCVVAVLPVLLTCFQVLLLIRVSAFVPPAHPRRVFGGGPMTTLKSEVPKEWESFSLSTTSTRNNDNNEFGSTSSNRGGGGGGSLYNNIKQSSFAFLPLQRPDRATEMLGSALATISSIIYILATSDKGLFRIVRGYEHHLEKMQETADNIIVAVIPMTSGDVVSVAFGEAFAGVFSAVVWSLIISSKVVVDNIKPSMSETGLSGMQSQSSKSAVVASAVADSDFFVTKAATFQVFTASGMSPIDAGMASAAVSVIPSEIVKFGSRHRQQLVEEELELDRILLLQQEKEKRLNPFGFLMDKMKSSQHQHGHGGGGHAAAEGGGTAESVAALVPVVHQQDAFIVEICADIIKWLEYDALCNHYGGHLGLFPVVEGALFGALCAVSSQMYTDLLYIGFGVEGEPRRNQLLSRTKKDWSDLYLYRILSVSTLFGIYQLVLSPFESFFETIFSGK